MKVADELEAAVVATGRRKDLFVGWIDGPGFPQALQHFGVSESSLPVAMVFNMSPTDNSKFKYSGEFDAKEVRCKG